MALRGKALRRSLLGCGAVAFATATVFAIIIFTISRRIEAKFVAAEEHLVSHESELADAVRTLISTHGPHTRINLNDLPAALAVPHVRAAILRENHVSLVLYYSPDTTKGFRVWSSQQSSDFQDQPTPITNVYRYSYCDDYPESPSNRAE